MNKKIFPILLFSLLLIAIFVLILKKNSKFDNSKFGSIGGTTSVNGDDNYKYIKILFKYTNTSQYNGEFNGLLLYLDRQNIAATQSLTITTPPATRDGLKSKANYTLSSSDTEYGNMFFNSIGTLDTGFNKNIYQNALSEYYYSTYTDGAETVVGGTGGTAYASESNVQPASGTRYSTFVTTALSGNPSFFTTVQATYDYYANTEAGITAAATLAGASGVNVYDTGTTPTTQTGANLLIIQAEVFALLRLMKVFRPGNNAGSNVDNIATDTTTKIYTITDSGYETTDLTNLSELSSTIYGRTFARKYMNLATGTYIFGVAIINNKLTYNTGDKYRFPFTISDIAITQVSVDTAGAPMASAPGTNLTAQIVFV